MIRVYLPRKSIKPNLGSNVDD